MINLIFEFITKYRTDNSTGSRSVPCGTPYSYKLNKLYINNRAVEFDTFEVFWYIFKVDFGQ